ncbi:MAG: hypothetical protein IPH86_06290 [bacterium]|nr:hypothetical protein [bacterium]
MTRYTVRPAARASSVSHVARALAAAGHEVVVLDNLSTGRRENLDGATGNLELVVGASPTWTRSSAAAAA